MSGDILRSTKTFREYLTDPYFRRRFYGLDFTEDEYTKACDVFGDGILERPDLRCAKAELEMLEKIMAKDSPAKEKCRKLWSLIKGKLPDAAD